MNKLALVIILAITVEAIIEYSKVIGKVLSAGKRKIAITYILAIIVSIVLCFSADADIYTALGVPFQWPYIGVALTGIFASRGANFVSDLVKKFSSPKDEVNKKHKKC